ncbi:MAG TPA: protein kinase [Candidatus Aminicenantes bacterium]|nr:protein kinase [Candidatus Aminicenantes bacterium]HRY66200.1 protein kinase [Candidatus Aminicenantes bacterium]HRZ73114.1 protein kinase [Candidatus Aminicenantes bacterium]
MATLCPTCRTENSETANFCSNCAAALVRKDTGSAVQPRVEAATVTYETPAWELPTGSLFGGRYQIIEQLGRGGMGRVYRALDLKAHEEVALKLIRPDIAEDKRTLERFVNEIKLAHMISHRNIGKMYHLGEDQGLHYITMEYVPGEDLKSFIRRSRRLDIATVVTIAKQVCSGLSEAHDAGIVHRDLKPGNIMIDKDGNAKILDFGIARALGTQGVTAEGSVIGTPEYMSPEQVEGRESDRRSDIYSFGVILFEMVTGRLPFAADTPFVVAFKQRTERPPSPGELNPQTPPDLSAIILRCLDKDPGRRYQTTEDVCRDLGKVEETIHTTPLPSPWVRRPTTRITALRAAALRFPWRKALIPVAAFLGIMSLGVVIRQILPKAKASVRTVAIVGFENLTGENSYDYLKKAIPNLLITSLEQSKFLDVVSWERLNDLAGPRDRDVASAADREQWFEACRRAGVDAIVLGSFTKAENLFATDAKIYDVGTKNLLKSAGARGEGIGSILRTQIDSLSRDIAQGVGLSDRKAALGTMPITQVTTASMDAYQLFLKGQESFERYYFDEAGEAFEKAAELDPSFALPQYYLVRVYKQMADAPRAAEAMERFKKLSKVNPGKGKDGLYVAALSAFLDKDIPGYVKGLQEIIKADPRDKRARTELAWFYKNEKKYPEAVAEFEKALAIDPSFGYALNHLAYTYAEMGEIEKALQTFERYAAADPGQANPFDSMGDLHFLTGDYDKARANYQQALALRSDFPSIWKLAYLYAMDGDYEAAIRWIDTMIARAQTDGLRADGHQWKALYYSLTGRLNDALAELGTAETLARTSGNKGLTDVVLRDAMWIAYDWGRLDLFEVYLDKRGAFRTEAKMGSETLNKIYELLYSGLYDVRTGDAASARRKLDEMKSLSSSVGEKEILFKEMAANQLEREVLFAEGKYAEALAVYAKRPPVKVDLSAALTVLGRNLPYLDDFACRVYLKMGARDKAVSEYERLVSSSAKDRESALIHPFSRLRLAALYESLGRSDRARDQYKALSMIWRQADPSLAEVAAVRKKVAQIKGGAALGPGGSVDSFFSVPFVGASPI